VGSIAVDEVVPMVAVTKKGDHPARRSSSIARASASARSAYASSAGILRIPAVPTPATTAALSIEKCASVEQ
jgi:hypothetical protein